MHNVPPTVSGGHYEELLEGPEQSVEILLLNGGKKYRGINIVDRHFVWDGDAPREWAHTNPSARPPEHWRNLYELAYKAARAVGATVGFFKCDTILTTGIDGTTAIYRDTVAGGGAALSASHASAIADQGRFDQSLTTDRPTVAGSAGVFLRRSDRGIAGQYVVDCVRV